MSAYSTYSINKPIKEDIGELDKGLKAYDAWINAFQGEKLYRSSMLIMRLFILSCVNLLYNSLGV